MIRVLLVDDHPVVRAGYARLIEREADLLVVAEAGTADEGYAAFVRVSPDITVTDLALPGAGGLDLLGRILARAPAARVLVFSMYDRELVARRALAAGAAGFLGKGAAPERLVEALRHLHAGGRLSAAADTAQPRSIGAEDARRLGSLTAREFEIFRLLAQGHPPTRCAQLLHLSPKTIANYACEIRDKLGVETTAAMAHLALGLGIIEAAPG